ncbi:gamma carbonic anhydrase family protein, partial [Erwinia amylovora]|uniref:gamma carbonic anhydrase family protein n=1 Tax=Erwinia amylovora TaxID=552 RepID=UPI0029F8B1C1|nr:gamma carbonic anhydrase family protein [Erwinia amylovora]
HQSMLHGCTIVNRVLIWMGSNMLDGVTGEDVVMIGDGSLVSTCKRLERGYLYLGRPAMKVRALTEAELSGLVCSAINYVRWKDVYISEESQTQP